MNANETIGSYELEAWIEQLGSVPVERIAHADYSQSYEMNVAHVYKLESGQYALVTESGCSCYEPFQADIDLYPTKRAAMEKFNAWEKENKDRGEL